MPLFLLDVTAQLPLPATEVIRLYFSQTITQIERVRDFQHSFGAVGGIGATALMLI